MLHGDLAVIVGHRFFLHNWVRVPPTGIRRWVHVIWTPDGGHIPHCTGVSPSVSSVLEEICEVSARLLFSQAADWVTSLT